MCGRYTQSTPLRKVASLFGVIGVPPDKELPERYNIAPTQPVPAVRVDADSKDRVLVELKWGLIPSWAKDATIAASCINARAETVATKPSFRAAFKKRRCLVVADGFYEWEKFGSTKGKKQPWHFRLKSHEPFGFAGLWEWWRNPADESEAVESCTIVTTEANEVLAPVHDRMPVILPPEHFDRWLDPDYQNVEGLERLLAPFDPNAMEAFPVSTVVNSPKNQGRELVAPIA